MAANPKLPIVTLPDELTTQEKVSDFIHETVTRRSVLRGMGIAGLGAVAFHYGCASSAAQAKRVVYVANAKGMVVADPARCVGCRRCEAACVAYNQGKTQPAIANVKVNRNLLYGPIYAGDATVGQTGEGLYGNFLAVQDTCRQCAHPVPCQLACPHDAIQVVDPVNARVVDTTKCVGCGICVDACPWGMPSLDGPVKGTGVFANKCHLCGGNPECVQACTTGALQYVAWSDRTKEVPARQVVPASIQMPPDVRDTCVQCH
ncbi:MAG TPA: 4Fe-4S dicluster domain-containing protein [Myxococcales bacterium]|nr:4Fe-4S dicluster domain-containing protein [Myxococcales bacterium]